MLKVSTRDNKYTICIPSGIKPVYLERYGKQWSPQDEDLKYVNAFISFAFEVKELRAALADAMATLPEFDREQIKGKLERGEYQ